MENVSKPIFGGVCYVEISIESRISLNSSETPCRDGYLFVKILKIHKEKAKYNNNSYEIRNPKNCFK
jgi:hypothetical protein